MSNKSEQTKAILENHLREFSRRNVEGVVRDYTEDSTFIVPSGPLHGPREISKFFSTFIETAPAGFLKAFAVRKLECVGELGYLVWDAAPWVQFATDTFVVRDGKITLQTFAAHPPSW